ncbi:NERD domain-containing protein [Clostridium gasigenes]|uniref:nuclease-related domain-containing protein n=1 Tax=Clostridium gasigenes TaxID=94869 RepID=UPI0014382F80|nr:nuclease-related domain-containing protein [Clostridium gasigenes]NKF05695.1 NERD domain-containing protein [Clostridium gasigenes]QSW19129.1 NERD domain-containing protein [Clostridium gasigenes]
MEIIIILFIIITLLKAFEPKIKGNIGERQVNRVLAKIHGYKVLHDITLETDTGTAQIDHVLIGRKRVFVIETKNYDGWIFGDEKAKYWTQAIYKKKSKFFNPIRQNYGHVKAIEKIVDKKYKDPLHSVIVFGHRCTLKKLTVTTPVLYIKELKKFISKFNDDKMLGSEDISYFYEILPNANITDKK